MPLAPPDSNSKYRQGEFTPKHPEKYIGKYPLIWRSSWELVFMQKMDEHPNVLQWASESISIPYVNPLTKKPSLYYPDFFVVYIDKHDKKHYELIEIKPKSHSLLEKAKNLYDQAQLVINTAKWQAAQAFCRRRNITFRVLTEEQLFHQASNALGAKKVYARNKPRTTQRTTMTTRKTQNRTSVTKRKTPKKHSVLNRKTRKRRSK